MPHTIPENLLIDSCDLVRTDSHTKWSIDEFIEKINEFHIL